MITRSWCSVFGLVLSGFAVAACAKGAGGDAYPVDRGGAEAGVVGADAQADVGTEASTRKDGGRLSDGGGAQDAEHDAAPGPAGDDASTSTAPDASTSGDAAADGAAADSAAADGAAADGSNGDGGSTAPTCNAQNCRGGCCRGDSCLAGAIDTACGNTGGACQDCTALAQTCVSGACQSASTNCPATCAGCCDMSDTCHASPSDQYCPTNMGFPFQPGSPCEDCQAEGFAFCSSYGPGYGCSPIP